MKYFQRDEIPGVGEYIDLRVRSDLSPRSEEAAEIGLANSLYATVIRYNDQLVAMGRVVGDSGCNFEIVDIAVHPDHQRKGLGGQIMKAVMAYLENSAPSSAYISLIADQHSPKLYKKFGFQPTAPHSIGMSQIL